MHILLIIQKHETSWKNIVHAVYCDHVGTQYFDNINRLIVIYEETYD